MKPTIHNLTNILYTYDVCPGDSVQASDYVRLMNGVRLAFGDKFKAWFMDCFTPLGAPGFNGSDLSPEYLFDFADWDAMETALEEYHE